MKRPSPITKTETKKVTLTHLNLDEDPWRGWSMDGLDHIIIYHVWTIGLYKNGHPMFDLRGVTTSLPHAKLWAKMLKRDKDFWHESWYRVHIEPRVANHLYGQSMRAMDEAIAKAVAKSEPKPKKRKRGVSLDEAVDILTQP